MSILRALFVVALLCCAGCEPRDTPCFSPDGKEIAFLVEPEPGKPIMPPELLTIPPPTKAFATQDVRSIGILTLADGKIRTFSLPEKLTADGLLWVGNQLLIETMRPLDVPAKDGRRADISYLALDPTSGKFTETPLKPHISLNPFGGQFKGKPCLYSPDDMNPDKTRMRIFSTEKFSAIGSLPFEDEGAGRGWFFRTTWRSVPPLPHNQDPFADRTTLSGIEVFNLQGRKVLTLKPEEIAKACYRQARGPICARVFPDGDKIFLGFSTETIFTQYPTEYTFGVFDIKTGALLWKGDSNALKGLPVAASDGVYIIEAKEIKRDLRTRRGTSVDHGLDQPNPSEPTSQFVLARYTVEGRTVVTEVKLAEGEQAARYSSSPDNKTIVVLVESPKPRLLLIPLNEKVAMGDLKSFPLATK